jgi:hypothetical protein
LKTEVNVLVATWLQLSFAPDRGRPQDIRDFQDTMLLSKTVGPSQGGSIKRRRASDSIFIPITPPGSPDERPPQETPALSRAVNVLMTEASALTFAARLYQTNPEARNALVASVDAVVSSQQTKGKLIVCGIGKSAYVGMKLVATLKSLGVACSFLHAAEAIHGDLGDIRSVRLQHNKELKT